jgi:hypothetical protein
MERDFSHYMSYEFVINFGDNDENLFIIASNRDDTTIDKTIDEQT